MIDLSKLQILEREGMYIPMPDGSLWHNIFIQPVGFVEYIKPKWLDPIDMSVYQAYWIKPESKEIEKCKPGHGDGNNFTAYWLERCAKEQYETDK